MKQFDLLYFLNAYGMLLALKGASATSGTAYFERNAYAGYSPYLDACEKFFTDQGFENSNHALNIVKSNLGDNGCSAHQLSIVLYKLEASVISDVGNSIYFKVDKNLGRELLSTPHNLDKEILHTIPDAIQDLKEARFCLAFKRSTAAVFHLMRAMEISVDKIMNMLAITSKQTMWGNKLKLIDAEIEKFSDTTKKDKWRQTSAYLHAIKNAWRNPTMHAKNSYSIAEANSIYSAVSGFLVQLANNSHMR